MNDYQRAIEIVPTCLNLAEPGDFLLALYYVEQLPNPTPPDRERWMRDFPVIDEWLPVLMDGAAPPVAHRHAIYEIIAECGGFRIDHGVRCHTAPREWLAVFRAAFSRGHIDKVALGAAVSYLGTVASGNGAPGFPAHSPVARRIMLNDLRLSDPKGLMDHVELEAWRNLPEIVTLYRGGRSTDSNRSAVFECIDGIHWSLDREYALSYLKGRGHHHTNAVILDAIKDMGSRGIDAGTPGNPLLVYRLGAPFLIEAKLPRSLVLASVVRGENTDAPESFVDFERIEPGMVRDVTPDAWRWGGQLKAA